jgi:hypothetical protein
LDDDVILLGAGDEGVSSVDPHEADLYGLPNAIQEDSKFGGIFFGGPCQFPADWMRHFSNVTYAGAAPEEEVRPAPDPQSDDRQPEAAVYVIPVAEGVNYEVTGNQMVKALI